MRHVILGTAGHIDHGKTTLVKALTGTDTDRLPEEKARGITIDLGFAHMTLGDFDVGIVDVPGHEGLIRNMLAGATGFDAMLLVVAGDEGVMPQTREHIAIAELLGVLRVVVAITKADLVDPEWLELVRADVQAAVASLASDAQVVAVSAVNGSGLDELRTALRDELARGAQRRDDDVFRMPIDRVFTVHGTGTVVTGTVWSGRLAEQANARLLPAARDVRIRGVQTHGAAVPSAGAGERSAFALAGVDRQDVQRGQSLVVGDAWHSVRAMTVRLTLLDGVTLKPRQRVRVHLGTAETMARVVMLGGEWAQLRLEDDVVARVRDRFVIRSYSPVTTIGGGIVAEVGRIRKRLTDADAEQLGLLTHGDAHEAMRACVRLAGSQGCAISDLPILAGVGPADVAAWTAHLPDDVAMVGDRLFPTAILNDASQKLVRRVRRFHDAHPLEQGIERAELLGELPRALALPALAKAERDGKLQSRGSIVTLTGWEPGFSPKQKVLRDQIVSILRDNALAPPGVPELTASLRSNEVRAVLKLLEAEGAVTQVNHDLYVDSAILAAAVRTVREQLAAAPRSASDFKTALPVSRKYLIPLLEYLDRSGVTRREGDVRWVVTD